MTLPSSESGSSDGGDSNEILSYHEMCGRERSSLQRGMNSFVDRSHSVVLMSTRSDAKYEDRLEDDGSTLIYEGHDAPRAEGEPDPKSVDQPEANYRGTLTENGKFHRMAQQAKSGDGLPRIVRVYQKLLKGIWSFNGSFFLTDSWQEVIDDRQVFKFRLELMQEQVPFEVRQPDLQHTRLIPPAVKQEVFKRDRGQCVKCGSKDNLHFDHVLPFSKGGSSMVAENVQLMCLRHNLQKSDKIE